MCGIIGYIGPKPMKDVLIKGLKRLEYRGYDSSGVAYFKNNDIVVHKSDGKITEIESTLGPDAAESSQGAIGHTRWATHGSPTPPTRIRIRLVTSFGAQRYYRELPEIMALVRAKGLEPKSETDSELFGFLVHFEMERGTPFVEAVRLNFLKINRILQRRRDEPQTPRSHRRYPQRLAVSGIEQTQSTARCWPATLSRSWIIQRRIFF